MALEYLPTLLYSQLFVTPKYPTHDFSGHVVIVTGGNVGLGLEAARHFTRLNAQKVILAVRTTSKGEQAKASIEQSTGRKDVVDVWSLDLNSYESVKAFAKKAELLPRLDAVVENAGISTRKYNVSEGHERTITTNVISTFLLALLLLPKLRETSTKFNTTPCLSIVSSEVHFFTQLPEKASPSIFEKLSDKDTADMDHRYVVSKLLEVLYFRQLVKAMDKGKSSRVTLNMLNPGWCHSNLMDATDDIPAPIQVLKAILARTTEVGSRTLVASAAAGPEAHGEYMSDGKIANPSRWVRSSEGEATGKRVWDELNDILEGIQPGVTKNI